MNLSKQNESNVCNVNEQIFISKKMTENELKIYLQERYPKENESCEWKEFKNLKNDFNGKEKDDVVSYVSALSNMDGGDLVIGVVDKTLDIVGTDTYNYDVQKARLRLKDQCANLPTEGLEVTEFVTSDTGKKVWVIHVPCHSYRLPVYAHSKAWQRVDDSLVEMTPSRLSAILSEERMRNDWTAKIIPDATLADLDPEAIVKARIEFKKRNPKKVEEVDGWDDAKFLDKAKITIKGQITNTAIILLGREESEHYLLPSVCKIRWSLKGDDHQNKDFHIFSIPMILAVDEVRSYIRNTTYRFTVPNSLFPDELPRYDIFTLREPLNNAVAHQDYSKQARIDIVEYDSERLVFSNHGTFLPESVEKVVIEDTPEQVYRNPFLVEAMRNVNMIETEGGGIRKLYMKQKERFFPMPTYDLKEGKVQVTIEGRVLDEAFARILSKLSVIRLEDMILLDKVQKHLPLTDEQIAYLRKKKLVEGRKNALYLSSDVVKPTKNSDLKTSYIKNKSFDDEYFCKMIVDYIKQFGHASRKDLVELLYDKLSDTLSDKQKINKIKNLTSKLKMRGMIEISSPGKLWILVDKSVTLDEL